MSLKENVDHLTVESVEAPDVTNGDGKGNSPNPVEVDKDDFYPSSWPEPLRFDREDAILVLGALSVSYAIRW